MSDQDKNDVDKCLICSDDCDENKNYQIFPKDETNCECVYTIHNECLQLLKKDWGTKCPICQKEKEDVVIEIRRVGPNVQQIEPTIQRVGPNVQQIEENQNRSLCIIKYLFYFLVIGLIIGICGTLLIQSDVV